MLRFERVVGATRGVYHFFFFFFWNCSGAVVNCCFMAGLDSCCISFVVPFLLSVFGHFISYC